MTDPTKPSTKTRYLRDKKNPERVMTLVTRVEGTTLTFATAVNAPPRVSHLDIGEGQTLLSQVGGDRFCRKVGSTIANGRLNCPRSRKTLTISDTQHPLILVLTDLMQDENHTVARIAKQEWEAVSDQLINKHNRQIAAKATSSAT